MHNAVLKAPSPICPHFSCGCRLGKYLQVCLRNNKILYSILIHTRNHLNNKTKMTNFLALVIFALACVIVNAQQQTPNQKPVFGQTFDEIVVSSDLNVRRKSKENRQSKRLLSNISPATLVRSENPSPLASRLISGYDSHVAQVTRKKRAILTAKNRYYNTGDAKPLAKSRKR